MKTFSDYVKIAVSAFLVLICTVLCAMRLMKVQVVNSDLYIKHKSYESTYTQKIAATRGEIVDADSKVIISNHVSYALELDEKNFPSAMEESNQLLLKLAEIMLEDEVIWEDTLPITREKPYTFLEDADEEELLSMKKRIGVNAYATAQNCIDVLAETYHIGNGYTDLQKRLIVGIRYTMLAQEFSMSNRFVLAKGIPMKTVTIISEMSTQLPGVSVEQTAERKIEQGDVLPHEIGSTGLIFAENAQEYLEKGYDLNAVVGISGIEYAMEEELRGKQGERTITLLDGTAVSDKTSVEMEPGHTVKLTVNSDFQRGMEKILGDFIENFPNLNSKGELVGNYGNMAGAIVVLDAKTGGILAEANYPTFNLEDYYEKYDELIEQNGNPLYNRCTMGLYRPGSTFKTITATAGLNEGVITPYTSFCCNQSYHFIDQTYKCTGNHQYISVANALRVSCNIFFYEVSRQLTIDGILEYAELFGIGQNTAIETGDYAGFMASPAMYRKLGLEWTVGQVLQAGIGNNEINVTPLQLACVANTIANKGVRYEPYLVDSIWDYNMETCLVQHEPTVAARIEEKNEGVFDTVTAGMVLASGNGFPDKYSLSNLGYSVAIKTGTPQFDNRVQDSAFIGFAPADDPQIAFAGIVEGGEYSKYMIRSILELYEEVYLKEDVPEETEETTENIRENQ